MSLILTFLGNQAHINSVLALASAKSLAAKGAKVLLVSTVSDFSLLALLDIVPSTTPTTLEDNLFSVHLSTTSILEKQWEEVKNLEKKYLQSPVLQAIYGQELPVLPGMDDALILSAIREYDNSAEYDVIVYVGSGDIRTIRLFAMPEAISGYARRFKAVIADSDIGKLVIPLLQPILGNIFSGSWNWDSISQNSSGAANDFLEKAISAVSDSQRVRAYLVTSKETGSIKQAKYLWGNAQLAGLTVAGVFVNEPSSVQNSLAEFLPLPINQVSVGENLSALVESLPDFRQSVNVPKPLEIDEVNSNIKVFLPGFQKKEVKLTQQGDMITLEAGDLRRNISLPPSLKGRSVSGAKFQEGYLIISL